MTKNNFDNTSINTILNFKMIQQFFKNKTIKKKTEVVYFIPRYFNPYPIIDTLKLP